MPAPYQYIARVAPGCVLFKAEPFISAIKNCGELVFTSKKFDDYNECVKTAQELLSTLNTLMSQLDDVERVIVSKLNPIYDDEAENQEEVAKAEGWSSNTIIRIYIADADEFKSNNVLSYKVHVNINVPGEFVKTTNSLIPQYQQ